MNRELALRFCAFSNFSSEEYRQYPSLDSYLVEFTRQLDERSEKAASIDQKQMEIMKADFDRAMINASEILGKAAFRRWPLSQGRRGPLNRAVFESQALALARYSLEELEPHADEITKAFRSLFDDPEYSRSVTVGTGDIRRVEARLYRTKSVLEELLA